MFVSSIPNVAGLVRAAGDPDATRTVYTIVVVLLVIGVVLVGVGIWVIRQTRSDPELLAPLEQMDTRAWRKRDPAGRQRMLDDVRPEGASPVRAAPDEPDVDDDFELPEKRVPTFADLEAVAKGAEATDEDGDEADEGELTAEDDVAVVEVEADEVEDDVDADEVHAVEEPAADEVSVDDAADDEPVADAVFDANGSEECAADDGHIEVVEGEPVESDR